MPTAFGARGCRFLVHDQRQCGATRRAGSSYCEEHHALCYVPVRSRAERQRLREIAKIGEMVGGRGRFSTGPMTDKFARRLEAAQR